MRQSTGEVRGLTIAASLWAIAAIGVVVGAGDYLMGTILAGLIFLILVWERLPPLSKVGHRKQSWRQVAALDNGLAPGHEPESREG